MTELDPFEARLVERLRRYASHAAVSIDAVELAWQVGGGVTRRLPFGERVALRPGLALIVAAGLLLALLGALAMGGVLRLDRLPVPAPSPLALERHPAELVPSGIEVVGGRFDYPRLWLTGDGNLWSAEAGHVTRIDLATAEQQHWSVQDDAAFATASAWAPARDGGVWLAEWSSRTVRWFDGERFADVVAVPGGVSTLGEGPDGSLWIATDDGTFRRDRTAWSKVADEKADLIGFDAAGAAWVGWTCPSTARAPLARFRDGTWEWFGGAASEVLAACPTAIAAQADGSVVVATTKGVTSFYDGTWSDVSLPAGPDAAAVAVGPDGGLWLVRPDASDGRVRVDRRDGDTWTTWDVDDGLPASGWTLASVVAPASVYVGTGDGIYRLADDRWVEQWSSVTGGPGTEALALLAVSRDEAWAVDGRATWHYRGTWQRAAPSPGSTRALALTPDGSLWATGEAGLQRLVGDAWVEMDTRAAQAITVALDGSVWFGGSDPGDPDGIYVQSFRRDGSAWTTGTALPNTDLVVGISAIAVQRDGTVWIASAGVWGMKPGLFRFVGDRWEIVDIGRAGILYPSGVAVAPDGTVWVTGRDAPGSWIARSDGTAWIVEELDGWIESIAIGASGTQVVAGTGEGLATFDGESWTRRFDGIWLTPSLAPDGTIWAIAATQVVRLPDPTD